jgi:hypothetical protein
MSKREWKIISIENKISEIELITTLEKGKTIDILTAEDYKQKKGKQLYTWHPIYSTQHQQPNTTQPKEYIQTLDQCNKNISE